MLDTVRPPLKIIILDDDHYPEGRVSQYVLPEFSRRGLGDMVIHFTTFEAYIDYLENPDNLNDVGLIVMDSSLDNGKQYYGFEQTLPYTINTLETRDRRDLIYCIMPASGRTEGIRNNQYAEELFERRGYMMEAQQCNLFAGGLAADPKLVCDRIRKFYDYKYPGMIPREGIHEIKVTIEGKGALSPETKSSPTTTAGREMQIGYTPSNTIAGPTDRREQDTYTAMSNQLYENCLRR